MRSSLFLALVLVGCKKVAPQVDALEQPLGLAPDVRHGTLKNGVQWYVAPGEGDARVAVVVGAGWVHEGPNEAGAAWAVADTLAGPDLQVDVGPAATVWTASGDVGARLEQLGQGVCCAKVEVDPAALEGRSAVSTLEGRLRRASRAGELAGSAWLEHPVEPDFAKLDGAAAQGFHDRWFTPGRTTVIVVGDAGVEVEDRIAAAFGRQPTPESPASMALPAVPDRADPVYTVWSDAEVASPAVRVLWKGDRPAGDTVRWKRDRLLEEVGLTILQARLDELAGLPEAPFTAPHAAVLDTVPGEGGNVLEATGDPEAVYGALLAEARRLAQWGVLNSEIRSAEKVVIARHAEAAAPTSDDRLAALVRLATDGIAVPGNAREAGLAEQYVPTFAVQELTDWAAGFSRGALAVRVVTPEGAPAVTVDALHAVEAGVAKLSLEPPFDHGALASLVEPPAPGAITSREPAPVEGFERWTLGNGMELWVRDMAGPVAFRAVRKGGLSGFPDATYRTAALAPAARAASGLGELDPKQITRFLAARDVQVNASIASDSAMLSGGAAPEDLEVALQLLYLHTTAARFTDEGFLVAVDHLKRAQEKRISDPAAQFEDAWMHALYPNDPRVLPISDADVEKLDPDGVSVAWADLFTDPSDFQLVIAGDLGDDFASLVETWLASIPPAKTGVDRTDRKVRRAKGALTVEVARGLEARSRTRIEYAGPLPSAGLAERERLEALGAVLEDRLDEVLLEARGGLYALRVRTAVEAFPSPMYRVRIEWTSHPALLETHRDAALGVIDALVAGPLDPFYVETVQNERRAAHAKAEQSPVYWVATISDALLDGVDPAGLSGWSKRNDALSVESLSAAARDWLREDRRAIGTLVPEDGAVTAPPPLSGAQD
ncbi:MAG: hypothetical protein R3F61_01100 [Myxococcota bacterium]